MSANREALLKCDNFQIYGGKRGKCICRTWSKIVLMGESGAVFDRDRWSSNWKAKWEKRSKFAPKYDVEISKNKLYVIPNLLIDS